MAGQEIEELVKYLARLPGLGPRSARAVLQLMRRRETLLNPLTDALLAAREAIKPARFAAILTRLTLARFAPAPHSA